MIFITYKRKNRDKNITYGGQITPLATIHGKDMFTSEMCGIILNNNTGKNHYYTTEFYCCIIDNKTFFKCGVLGEEYKISQKFNPKAEMEERLGSDIYEKSLYCFHTCFKFAFTGKLRGCYIGSCIHFFETTGHAVIAYILNIIANHSCNEPNNATCGFSSAPIKVYNMKNKNVTVYSNDSAEMFALIQDEQAIKFNEGDAYTIYKYMIRLYIEVLDFIIDSFNSDGMCFYYLMDSYCKPELEFHTESFLEEININTLSEDERFFVFHGNMINWCSTVYKNICNGIYENVSKTLSRLTNKVYSTTRSGANICGFTNNERVLLKFNKQ